MVMKVCRSCGLPKPVASFGKYYNGHSGDLRRTICEKCRKNRPYHTYRYMFLKTFDFKCQCCGIDDIRFLTLDHVQNDGHKDAALTPIQLYKKAFEDKFNKARWNCLCWNCNCARAQNNGICPHVDKITKEEFKNSYSNRANYREEPSKRKLEETKAVLGNLSTDEIKQLIEQLQQS